VSPFRHRLKPAVLAAFTIIELLVSIGIFVVSATLMLGAMFGATDVFRKGEAARQAGDEATAVIAALQEDLTRAVPSRLRDGAPAPEWGRLWTRAGSDGNCMLGLVVENPDRSQLRWIDRPTSPPVKALVGVRKWVFWQVLPSSAVGASAADAVLQREEWDITEDGTVLDVAGNSMSGPGSLQTPLRREVITRGCLHFGVWIELAEAHRMMAVGTNGPDFRWESQVIGEEVFPFSGSTFDTRQQQGGGSTGYPPFYPQPDALRISLVLTGGGRFATRGTLVRDIPDATATTARISGIKALPTTGGSLLRIDNEWVRYDDFRGGQVTIRSDGRGALRSTASAHSGRVTVLAGQPFSLVVALPR